MSKIVNVAVAVIYFNNRYLLGYRDASQHQGNRYEFVGGKIEGHETPRQGLTREVQEELGIDICQNLIVKMGIIRHDYPEKSVALHCFKILLNNSQFEQLQGETGNEGQAISWAEKGDLLTNKYPLPDANARVLQWLTLPDTIYITKSFAQFADAAQWVDFYSKRLAKNAHVYIRPQTNEDNAKNVITALCEQREDITPLIQYQTVLRSVTAQNSIIHLNHQQLVAVDFHTLPKQFVYFASCHDPDSLHKANKLSKTHTVMGCFLSPVKATPTHPETIQQGGIGWQAFGELAKLSDVPVFALGGVNQADLMTAWQANAYGIAGIRLLNNDRER